MRCRHILRRQFIGDLIAEAMEKVSSDGVITVEESDCKTYSEVEECS